MSIESMIAGQIYIGTPDLEVIKIVFRKLAKTARTADMRKERRKVYKEVLKHHHKNQELFKAMRF